MTLSRVDPKTDPSEPPRHLPLLLLLFVGSGGSADWVHCPSSRVITTLGGGAYSISGSHWAFGKFGASFQPRGNLWFYGDANVGSLT